MGTGNWSQALCSCSRAGWVGACEVCAPGSAWEVRHPRSPSTPPPRATEGDYPASFAGFTQRLGGPVQAEGGSGQGAVSMRHPGQLHTCRESPPLCLLSGGLGATDKAPRGGQQPT